MARYIFRGKLGRAINSSEVVKWRCEREGGRCESLHQGARLNSVKGWGGWGLFRRCHQTSSDGPSAWLYHLALWLSGTSEDLWVKVPE
ncbi:hypothetical protein Pmani_039872 [Petrolisthes manimaculis]|uniref:Uncharacterized protein n=1 Tax=Petrolisthes manimaculis TaxID=1843537 RepID=A0AAE1TJ57_9EUCA|nr:hypothetical protein Pmani_039872 [Petrolisthes manimaculis]